MRKILLPTDFSESAQNAADFCIEAFDFDDVKFVLLHAYYLPYAVPGEEVTLNDPKGVLISDNIHEELARIKLKFPSSKAEITHRIEFGDLVAVTKFILQSEDVFALAIGTRGAGRIEGTLIGSQTIAVIKNLNLPIFVIPERAQFKGFSKILLTTDLLQLSGHVDMDELLQIAKDFESKITVLHVRKLGEQQSIISSMVKKEIHNRLGDIPHNFEKTIAKNIATSINQYVKEKPMDLVVTLSKSGNLFRRIFHKSISKQIALHTDIPLLVIHSKE